MTTFSYGQLEQLWINNGGDPAVAPVAAAVALAESSGRSDNNNYNDSNGRGGTQTSWGLWQISDGTHNMPVPNIDDPNVNARAAVAKYKGEGNSFAPAWGTYDTGVYKKFLQGGVPPSGAGLPSGSGGGGGPGAQLTGGPGGGISQWIIPGIGGLFGGVLGPGGNPLTDLGAIANDLQTFLNAYLWLYNPANWVRIGSFIIGLFFLAGAAWMIKEAMT